MSIYEIILKSKKEVANGTMKFLFEKPPGFSYKAGQFADYTLINPTQTDAKGNTRGFTIVCAPYENDIGFATRMGGSAFKAEMRTMALGTKVTLDAPYGSFNLHNNTSIPAVFITGGIGVTPVRSIVLQATHDETAHKICLFDFNNTPEDAAFLDEFKRAESMNKNFTFIPSMTNMESTKQEWTGETGLFTKEMLNKYVDDISHPIYYISGPPKMVHDIRNTLNTAGVDDDNIRTEEFAGY